MTRIARLMKLHRLMDKATDGTTGSTGGTGTPPAEGSDGATGAAEGEGGDSGDGQGDDAAAAAAAAAAAKAKPSDAEAKLLKEVMGAKTKLEKTNQDLVEANRRLKDFEGIDPAKVRALLKEQAEAETAKLEAKGDYERLKKQMADAHAAETAALKQQVETANAATATLEQTIANLTVGNAFGQSKFVTEDLTLTVSKAKMIYGSQFEYVDGKVVGFDKPAGAKDRTMLVDAAGNALNFEDAMRKVIEADPDKEQLLKSKSKPGAGSQSTTRAARQNAESNKPQRNSIEKIANGLRTLAK